MAEETRRMSRRGLLAAAGLTPVMLVACAITPAAKADVAAATMGTAPNSGQKYAKVCERLWAAFLKGTGTTKVGPNVINKAVMLASGHIVTNLALFPDDGEDINTMFCAWRCGVKAAEKAGTEAVSEQNFADAYDETKAEMAAVWVKLGKDSGLAC